MNAGAGRRLWVLFTLAVALNYPWELGQTPFYEGMRFPGAWSHCFVAALGDGLLVMVIQTTMAVLSRSADWYRAAPWPAYLLVATAGLIVALAVEWWGLHIAGRWRYSPLMPLVPGIGIGAIPLLQMMVLPPAVFLLARRLVR